MATLTQVTLTCDMCGNATDVRTQTIGLDGKTFEVDLCQEDRERLNQAVADYVSKARKSAARQRPRHNARKPRSGDGAAAAKATASQQGKGIYVYGILPADIEMTADMPGVGESPGLLRVVRFNDLAALISEVDLSSRLGSPDDLRTHTDILDATATEVPVLPLPFGVVLTSEDAVAEDLLAAHREKFADALEQLEGRAEFVVRARYLQEAVLGEVLPDNEQSAAARREEDTRAVREAMNGHCVASVVRKPAHELDAVHVAFLVDADQESEVERVIADLARDWAGQIEVELLGPMAAYDFVRTPEPVGRVECQSVIQSAPRRTATRS